MGTMTSQGLGEMRKGLCIIGWHQNTVKEAYHINLDECSLMQAVMTEARDYVRDLCDKGYTVYLGFTLKHLIKESGREVNLTDFRGLLTYLSTLHSNGLLKLPGRSAPLIIHISEAEDRLLQLPFNIKIHRNIYHAYYNLYRRQITALHKIPVKQMHEGIESLENQLLNIYLDLGILVEAIKRALKEKKAYEPSVGLYPGVDLNFLANIFYKTSGISKEHDLIFKGEEDMVRHIEVETLRLSVRNENINIIKLISELIRKLKTFILLVALYPYVNMERAELCFIYACDKCLSEIGIRGILKETMPFSIEELEKKYCGRFKYFHIEDGWSKQLNELARFCSL